jgi:hypothetical protein
MRHHADGSPAFVSFLLGGLTGAAIATLLLPRPALDTRRRIARRMRAKARQSWPGPRPGDDRPAPPPPDGRVPEPALGTGAAAESRA